MSRCCCKCRVDNSPYVMPAVAPAGVAPAGLGNSCCNFPCFIILILILLQFGKKDRLFGEGCEDDCNRGFGIDRGILFIIALYYLSCCNPCA